MSSFGFGAAVRQIHRVEQSAKLQLRLVQGHIFALRMELIQTLRGERYTPVAECPSCRRKLTPMEIMDGFNQDPNDFTTCCTRCGMRFEPHLICLGNGVRIELPFYCDVQCDVQTLARLRGLETLEPEQLAREHPAVYRAAIVHHGGIRQAFERIGVRYPFEEIADWKNKIRPFLGRLPDTVIAKCVDMSAKTIGEIRRKLGVPRYTLRQALEEGGE